MKKGTCLSFSPNVLLTSETSLTGLACSTKSNFPLTPIKAQPYRNLSLFMELEPMSVKNFLDLEDNFRVPSS